MSKQLIVDRHTTPGTPVLDPVATVKVPVYDTMTDVEADLANLEEGQIVATKDTGDELAQPVNVVEEGNLHAVSSNAVAEMFQNPISSDFTISFSNKTANVTGLLYASVQKHNSSSVIVKEDNTELLKIDMCSTNSSLTPITVLIRKGHQYMIDRSADTSASIYIQKFIKFF